LAISRTWAGRAARHRGPGHLTSKTLQLYASYALVDARFLDTLQVGSNSPFADADGNVQIVPETEFRRYPATGSNLASIIRSPTLSRLERCVVRRQPVFCCDGSNQAARLPGYSVFNVHASYQINKTFQLYGRVDNILDNRYATYGTFFDTLTYPIHQWRTQFTDARSVSPARPRAFYAGLKAPSSPAKRIAVMAGRWGRAGDISRHR